MADDNVILDSYFGDVNNSFYAGPNGADFHIRKVYGNLREMLEDTINDNTVLIGDYFLVNYGNQNIPDDGSGNPNGRSYNRNKAIDAYGGEVEGYDPGSKILNATPETGSADQTIVQVSNLPLGERYDWFLSSNRNYWYELYYRNPGSTWAVRSINPSSTSDPYGTWTDYIYNYDDLPNAAREYAPKILATPGYYNATLWRRKETEITQQTEGIINPFDYFELMFQSVSAVPNIDVATHSINAGSIPTASISGTVESKTIEFGLPTPWGFTATVSAVHPLVTPTAAIEDISGDTTTKRIHFSLPKAWGITIGNVVASNPSVTPTVSMIESGETKELNFTLPKAWDITATITPTSGAANVNVVQSDTTKTFEFNLPVVDATCVNPNLVYNPWFTVNSRGYEEYRGQNCGDVVIDKKTRTAGQDVPDKLRWITSGDYTLDQWLVQNINSISSESVNKLTDVKQNGQDGIILTSCSSQDACSLISYLDSQDTLHGKTVTLSIMYKLQASDPWIIKSSVGTLWAADSGSAIYYPRCNIYDNNNIIAQVVTYRSTEHIFVRLIAPKNSSIYFKKVKVEIGGFSTLAYDTDLDQYKEYNKCVHRYTTDPSNQEDDYARASIVSPINVFTLTSDKVSSLYEIGKTYLDNAQKIGYGGNVSANQDFYLPFEETPLFPDNVTLVSPTTTATIPVLLCHSITTGGLTTGTILNATNEDIQLLPGIAAASNASGSIQIDKRVPMVCGTFAELMLAGIPYQSSRIKTGTFTVPGTPTITQAAGEYTIKFLPSGSTSTVTAKVNVDVSSKLIGSNTEITSTSTYTYNNQLIKSVKTITVPGNVGIGKVTTGRLTDGNNKSQTGSSCFDLKSPIIKNYWGRYEPQEQLYSSTFARLLDDAGLLHKIKDITDIRPGDLIFFNEIERSDGSLPYRRWNAMQHVELFLGWTWNFETQKVRGWSLSTNASATKPSVTTSNNETVVSFPSGIVYRFFEKETAFTSTSSRLGWYARLSAGASPLPTNLFDEVEMPLTWNAITSSLSQPDAQKTWTKVHTDANKKLENNRAYTILFTATHDVPSSYAISPKILWSFQTIYGSSDYVNSGQSLRAGRVLINDECFQVGVYNGENLYACNIRTVEGNYNLTGLAICPSIGPGDGDETHTTPWNDNISAAITHLWVYDKLVSY